MEENKSYCFLVVGNTSESKEASEGFKRYVGLGSSYIVGFNPNAEELQNIYGREMNPVEYVTDGDNGKEAHLHFIVKTDPEQCNGIEMINRAMFTLRNTPAYNKDQTKVQVIDSYGNVTWVTVEQAKAHTPITYNGVPAKIANDYRMACVGEADLVGFLKTYLGVKDAFDYKNGTWTLKENSNDYKFALENIKDYFKGDFKEIKEALALQPNNKVKLLYGVRTTDDNKQYQTVNTRYGFVLPNNAGVKAIERLEKELANSKNSGSWPTTEFKVQELAEYTVEATNLAAPETSSAASDEMPW